MKSRYINSLHPIQQVPVIHLPMTL